MERKIDDLQNILQGAVSVKQMPEFQKLDRLIAEFLQTQSYEFIPDILVAADAAKNTANRYIVTATPCAAKPCFRTSRHPPFARGRERVVCLRRRWRTRFPRTTSP